MEKRNYGGIKKKKDNIREIKTESKKKREVERNEWYSKKKR
jgi:hypothetical protein